MFKTYRFETLWTNKGDSSGEKLTIIRGNPTIEKEGDDDDYDEIDPLYNLGDRLIIGDVIQKDPDNEEEEMDKSTLTYAFMYRRHASSSISPFKLPYSYNLIWDSSGTRNTNPKKIRVWSLNCPPDYVALGYVTTTAPNYPKRGDIYCVRRYFVELGNLAEDEQKGELLKMIRLHIPIVQKSKLW